MTTSTFKDILNQHQGEEGVMGGEVGEKKGVLVFINIFDYYSDFDQKQQQGCLATIRGDDEIEVSLYTSSERLQAALLAAYSTKCQVIVAYGDKTDNDAYSVRAIWTPK